ncbi:VPLPA-CTERM sorting domain-containing protein [Rhodobacteraceae bacterium N5(2021)]|uniref:VPLPA-CTERM sorting domain-containing protein n=1 Tax=Gymnodinialimonas phycosphaerae TaxID=2841589 RepID=A0A975YES5_9RHOB|nr:VPLPA-CTERM sorting domain-containing protein [Gymnodinialimonas phycosphaerae]MBY4893944.1 VPLPA-CTERM sorting domain-containing protein [Gymnodinialimonas phycosphaerae]
MKLKYLFTALILSCGLSTGAMATTFNFSTTVATWPDATNPSADLEDLTIAFAATPDASSDATVSLTVVGDFNGSNEFLDVFADGFNLGRFFETPTGSILVAPGVTETATIALADLLPLISDGLLSFLFSPTQAQQAPQGVNASLEFSISYDIAVIPLPAGGLLLVAGLGGLAALGRRKRRAA